MIHPRLLMQVLSPAEIAEWNAYLTLKHEEQERARKKAGKRRR